MSDSVKIHTEDQHPLRFPIPHDHAGDPQGFDREIGLLTVALATPDPADPVPASLHAALTERAESWADRDLLMTAAPAMATSSWASSVWGRVLATAAAVALMGGVGYAWLNQDRFDPTEPGLVRQMERMIDDTPDVALASFASPDFGSGRIAYSASEQCGYLDVQSLASHEINAETITLAIMIDDAMGNAYGAGTVNVHCFSLNRFVAPFTPDQPVNEPMMVRLVDVGSDRTLVCARLQP